MKGFVNALSVYGFGAHGFMARWIDISIEGIYGHDVVEVSFVVLDDYGDIVRVEIISLEVLDHVFITFHILLSEGGLAVGDEDDGVSSLENKFSGGVVTYLPWNGVELKLYGEVSHFAKCDWHEVEKKRPVRLCGKGKKFSLAVRGNPGVEILKVSGLPAQARTVIDDFKSDFFGSVIDKSHVKL